MSKLIRESQIAQQQAQQLHQVPPMAAGGAPLNTHSTAPLGGDHFGDNQGELPVISQRVEIPRQSLPEMPPPKSNP